MTIFIDGDNGPGTNTKNIEQLRKSDRVILFYASDNKYYLKDSNKKALAEAAVCSIEFKCVEAGNCAVDLAVAMELAAMLSGVPNKIIVLVSKDKHFGIISRLATQRFTKCYVVQATTVDEAINKYRILELENLAEMHNWMTYTLGEEKGKEVYSKAEQLFTVSHKTKNSYKFTDAMHNFLFKTMAAIIGVGLMAAVL